MEGEGREARSHLGLSEAFASRMRRAGFAYTVLMLFYFLDVSSTVLLTSTGRFVEANPINRGVLETGGPAEWILFRLVTFAGVTVLVAIAFAATATVLSHRAPGKRPFVDTLEDGVLGMTIVFYAFTLFHNLASVSAARP